MKKLSLLIIIGLFLTGCSKMEDKKLTDNKNQQQQKSMQENPHNSMQGNTDNQKQDMTDVAPETATDPQADKISKEAYDFENTYGKDKSDANKTKLISMHMEAGNYLMFKANISPKKKYGPALKHYRRALELDPKNAEAQANKKQIEDIYEMMGRPIPQ